MTIPVAGRRVALVTCGGSGIGRACALALARAGCDVAVLDRDAGGVSAVVAEVAALGVRSLGLQADVADDVAMAAAVDRLVAEWGRLDAAVHCAGVEGVRARLADYAPEQFDEVVRVNLRGTYVTLRHALRVMLPRGSGAIVSLASAAAITPATNMPAYNATKAAIVHLTKSTALDYASSGIRVNAVSPGPVRTPMQERLRGQDADLMGAAVPMGRTADPDEIAAAVVWLCSEAASYVTGHNLVVDGGCVIQGPRHGPA